MKELSRLLRLPHIMEYTCLIIRQRLTILLSIFLPIQKYTRAVVIGQLCITLYPIRILNCQILIKSTPTLSLRQACVARLVTYQVRLLAPPLPQGQVISG